ncbi:MAG: hypothetical protein GXY86_00620 [Firmicutes bacterium]|nr:hypothetical protein [Bacillota bacterium]
MMQMSARRFFLLQKNIAKIQARENYDRWLMSNWSYLGPEAKEFKEKYFANMVKVAFPDSETAKPYWDNPEPGLKQVK